MCCFHAILLASSARRACWLKSPNFTTHDYFGFGKSLPSQKKTIAEAYLSRPAVRSRLEAHYTPSLEPTFRVRREADVAAYSGTHLTHTVNLALGARGSICHICLQEKPGRV